MRMGKDRSAAGAGRIATGHGRRRGGVRRAASWLLALVAAWAALAYLVLPFAIEHYEHQRGIEGIAMVTRTADGIEGDPINTGVVGTHEELVRLMDAAGWHPADPVTLSSSIGIIGSVALDRSYEDAPVSPLFFSGRRQDLAFEQQIGRSASARRHVRFWLVLDKGREGRPVWLGAATLDAGVGFSHYTGAVTHRIAPDIDTTRDMLFRDFVATGTIGETYEVSGIGPTLFGHNGEGNRYWTDGEVRFSVIAPAGTEGHNPPTELAAPAIVAVKNAIWAQLGALASDPSGMPSR